MSSATSGHRMRLSSRLALTVMGAGWVASCGSDSGTADALEDRAVAFECGDPTGPMPCDGMSRAICQTWAERVGAGYDEPISVCFGEIGCPRAEVCEDPFDSNSCRCGAEPQCGVGEVCARLRPREARRCLPCTANTR
jgi:hypothetical protein